jgi:PAS domain S-box-containing protein
VTGESDRRDPLSQWLEGVGLATLDALTESAVEIIGIIDPDLVIRYLNRTAPGLTREQVIGKRVIDLLPPDRRANAHENYVKVLQTGQQARFETVYSDGRDLRIWEVRIGPIRFEGNIVGLIATTTNVTEQRRAEADRDRFFSLSLDMLVVASPDGKLKRLNPAFGDILGYHPDDLIAKPFIDLVHPDDRARTMEAFEGLLTGAGIDLENRYRRRDGSYRVFSWRATVDPITHDVYGVARDITKQRATEAQLMQAQKMEAVGQLAGGVAHDFNNLMQAILGNTELAMTDAEVTPDVVEHLREVQGASRRAADLTKQLLAFSRRQALRPVPVDLNGLIRQLNKMLRRLLPENISIDFIPGHNVDTVKVDPTQMEQVIVNLCVNARDAMQAGGRLTIETENVLINGRYVEAHPWAKPGRYVLLTVTDTGAGMSAEVREHIFEPFYTTKDSQHGTGLGLATVYGIVRQHNGMIHVYSEIDDGTTFKVYLPVDARLATGVGDKLEPVAPGGQETVLLAEDEERVRRVMVQILERAGYRVIAAASGREAVRMLREQTEPVHLVILDVVMPELGGPETWEQIKSLRPDVRVLFTSGHADERHLKRLPPGAVLVEKPFRMEDLLHTIRNQLERHDDD